MAIVLLDADEMSVLRWWDGRIVDGTETGVEFDLELKPDLKLPADLAGRALPAQQAQVDGAKLLAEARLPTRRDRLWHVELAPLTRMEAWGVPEIKPGAEVAVLGFTFAGDFSPVGGWPISLPAAFSPACRPASRPCRMSCCNG